MSSVLLRIAIRNLRLHLTKTLIIGFLMMLGIAILVIGNSFMDTINTGMKKNFTENYTGNIFIVNSDVEEVSLIFSSDAMSKGPRSIPEFQKVNEIVSSYSEVKDTTGQLNGISRAKSGELGEAVMVLFGVNPQSYRNMFSTGINIIKGSFLDEDGSAGIVLSKEVARQFASTQGKDIEIGDMVTLTTINTVSGAKIREVPVKGIHDYGDTSFDMQLICFIDENTLRIMNGMVANTAVALNLSDAEQDVLGNVSEDDLFGSSEDDLFASGGVDDFIINTGIVDNTISSEDEYLSLLGDTSQRDIALEVDQNAWNYLLVKLNNANDTSRMIKSLNQRFEKEGIDATAYEWIKGAGMSAQAANALSIVFNVLIFVIAIVAVIIIMNTLVISVSERFGEIGTMRAIGAKKSFVRQMITLETMIISLTFGLLGVLLGVIVIYIFRIIGIEATNLFLRVLLGGDVFRPDVSISAIFSSVIAVTLVGIISSLYPVSVALKVSPLEAMNKG